MKNLASKLLAVSLLATFAAPAGFAGINQVPPIPTNLKDHYATRLNSPDKYNKASESAVKGDSGHALFTWMGGDRVAITTDPTKEWKTLAIRGIANTTHLLNSNIKLAVMDSMGQAITHEYYEVGPTIPMVSGDNNVYLIFNAKGGSMADHVLVTVINGRGQSFTSEKIPYTPLR